MPDPGAPKWQSAAYVLTQLSEIWKFQLGADNAANLTVVTKLRDLIVGAGGTPPPGIDDIGQLCKVLADATVGSPDPNGAIQTAIKGLGQAINDLGVAAPGTCTIQLTTPATTIPTDKAQCDLIYGTDFEAS
jgi:hypothetical protein